MKQYKRKFRVTAKLIDRYAQVVGDFNPLHTDKEYAKETKFKTRIAHGMLIGGLISSVIGNDFPGYGTIYLSQRLDFRKPVKINDDIHIKIREINTDEKKITYLGITVTNQHNTIVVEGDAKVMKKKWWDK